MESEGGVGVPTVSPRPALLSAALETLAGQAQAYAAARNSANTVRAYASDWRQFECWCRRQGLDTATPDPQVVGLYLTAEMARSPDRRQRGSQSARLSAGSPLSQRITALPACRLTAPAAISPM